MFPKGDHVNVGVGWLREGPRLRSHLARVCRDTVADRLEGRGYRLDRRAGASPARGRTLLVGDAAGLVDPLSGDGMFEAFVSGRLAAEAVLADARRLRSRSRACARPPLGSVLGREARAGALSPPDLRSPLPFTWRCDRRSCGRGRGNTEGLNGLAGLSSRVADGPRTCRGDPGRPLSARSYANLLRHAGEPADGSGPTQTGSLNAAPLGASGTGMELGRRSPRSRPRAGQLPEPSSAARVRCALGAVSPSACRAAATRSRREATSRSSSWAGPAARRCRHCSPRVDPRYPAVELTTAC